MSFFSQAGLRAVHDLGPELRRAISGNLDEEDYDNTKDVEEPMHRVSIFVMKMCIVYQKSLLPLKSLATNFLLYTQILSIKFHVFLFYLQYVASIF
jgi:hypothetical protein